MVSNKIRDPKKIGECPYCEDPVLDFQLFMITPKRKRKVHTGCWQIFDDACERIVKQAKH